MEKINDEHSYYKKRRKLFLSEFLASKKKQEQFPKKLRRDSKTLLNKVLKSGIDLGRSLGHSSNEVNIKFGKINFDNLHLFHQSGRDEISEVFENQRPDERPKTKIKSKFLFLQKTKRSKRG